MLLKIGLLNAQTAKRKIEFGDDIPAYNYTVATFRKQVFGRSNIGGIITSKQAINFSKNKEEGYDFGDRNRYNRVYGLQYNLLSSNDRWTGSFYGFRSDDPVHESNNWAHGTNLRYNVRNFSIFWNHEYIGDNFVAETGFFPRTGYFMFGPFTNYRFYPDSKIISQHGPSIMLFSYLDKNWSLTDRQMSFRYGIDFLNTSEINIQIQDTYVKLFADFDPTWSSFEDTTVIPLPAGSDYNWQEYSVSYRSDSRKDYSFSLEAGYGGFYNGTGLNFNGRIVYRIRPLFNMAINYSYNRIDLADPYPDGAFWLIGPRIELTFTEKIYWTNYIQYNEQSDNININSRFQWRFAPASDFFLVYTDNYFPAGLENKNRAVILKISYWINI